MKTISIKAKGKIISAIHIIPVIILAVKILRRVVAKVDRNADIFLFLSLYVCVTPNAAQAKGTNGIRKPNILEALLEKPIGGIFIHLGAE